ncbi:AAA family ATPase [Bifidobacterium saguinibicoloris]|uniref:AAA family ATPase n=1 Tax=Bifidobacterium saguinibicoloris TaxID=2834433 RepID=UPI001C56DF1C|nr:AAA family ATPase [Bifidobacterium saguinibicoloris]MBW3080905.1 AAA family ATPase [Bifidobacterium saguinibicoloris]
MTTKTRPTMPSVSDLATTAIVENAMHLDFPSTEDAMLPGRHPMFSIASQVAKTAPRFLDYPMLPVGVLTLIAGRAGVSKSTLSLYRAALATRGRLAGKWKGQPVNVCISGIEDSESMQRMRLEAEDADLDRVTFLSMADEHGQTGVRLPDDLDTLAPEFRRRDIRLWVIDPITSAMDGDSNKRDDVRAALDPLAKFASDLDMAVVGILHFSKGGGYASDKISGSHAFRDAVRSLLTVARDDEDGTCVVTIDKSSYTTEQNTSYSYGLISHDVRDDTGHVFGVPKITGFMPTERTVNEVINKNINAGVPEPRRAGRGEVADWLADWLTEHGPTPFNKLEDAAGKAGYTAAQLRKVRERNPGLIATARDPNHVGRGIGYIWSLNDDAD